MPIVDGVIGRQVHWLAEGEVIDTFDDFGEYVASMIAYTKRRTSKLRAQSEQP
ncbi:hypothetical protein [Microbacterium sp.]|uniref:hypothetical protein n=1 Tax=Microbacterium sp. TaxID=51671 RepID=UPI003F72CDFB